MKFVSVLFALGGGNVNYMSYSLGERIRLHRKNRGLSLDDLARLCGLTSGYLGRLERNEEKYSNPSIENIKSIASALGVHFYDILSDRAELAREILKGNDRPPLAQDAPSFIPNDIPEVGLAQAGRGTFFDSDGVPMGTWPKKYHRPADVIDPHAYVVRVDGDSMEPMLKKGNRLLCVTNEEAQNGDLVVVQLKSGEVMAKELSLRNETIVLKSINPLYDPVVVKRDEVRAMHPVVWIKRK